MRWSVACTLLIVAFSARAAVNLSEATQRYTIRGITPADLRREMNVKGPLGSDGKRFDGFTRWHIDWQYWYRRSSGRCAIDRVQTKVKIDITLPAWQNENTGSAETRTQWQRYVAALTRHEQGHRQHGVDAAHEIDNAIGTLPPTGNCDALGAKANAAGTDIIRKYNQRDLDYDRDTRHGATQGARFP